MPFWTFSGDTRSEMTTLCNHTQDNFSQSLCRKKSNAPSPEQVYSNKHSTQEMDPSLNPRLLPALPPREIIG